MPYSWLNWATMTMYRYNSSRRSHSLFWLNIWYKRTTLFMRLDTDGEWPFLFQIWTICFSCLSKYKISGFSAYVFRVQVHILEFHFLQWQHLGSIIKFALLFRIAGQCGLNSSEMSLRCLKILLAPLFNHWLLAMASQLNSWLAYSLNDRECSCV